MARSPEVKLAPRPVQRSVAVPRRLPAAIEHVSRYLREIWIELSRVEWPSRREIVSMTVVVVVLLMVTAIVLGIFDYIFTVLVKQYLVRPPG